MSLRLPRVLARLGHPAIWAALAGHTGLAFDLEALLDHVDLCCAVQEVAAPRAEHDVHGQRDGEAAADQLAQAGRRATLEQAVAQLNPGRTALFRGNRGGDTVGTHLQPG